jgi:hypothetical protein
VRLRDFAKCKFRKKRKNSLRKTTTKHFFPLNRCTTEKFIPNSKAAKTMSSDKTDDIANLPGDVDPQPSGSGQGQKVCKNDTMAVDESTDSIPEEEEEPADEEALTMMDVLKVCLFIVCLFITWPVKFRPKSILGLESITDPRITFWFYI